MTNGCIRLRRNLCAPARAEVCAGAVLRCAYQKQSCVQFINAQTIKLPRMSLSGYKDHIRTPGFNAGTMSNDWEPKKLTHDRDVEFYIDPMDIDETNLVMSVANIQTTSKRNRQSQKRIPTASLSYMRS